MAGLGVELFSRAKVLAGTLRGEGRKQEKKGENGGGRKGRSRRSAGLASGAGPGAVRARADGFGLHLRAACLSHLP